MPKCPICLTESEFTEIGNTLSHRIICRRCGEFCATREFVSDVCFKSNGERGKVSSIVYYLRRRYGQTVFLFSEKPQKHIENHLCSTVDELLKRYPISLTDRVDMILDMIDSSTRYKGDVITIESENLFMPDNLDSDAALFVRKHLETVGLINFLPNRNDTQLTFKAYERIDESNRTKSDTNQAFIAMWFSDDVTAASEAIHEAIRTCGYKPVRIDGVEHNNKICDEIVGKIRQSKFVVCDFTGQRGGVYFEAGYAMGLGIPVIWTCHSDEVGMLHFDTRQYNHITWTTPDDLREKLFNRIKATI